MRGTALTALVLAGCATAPISETPIPPADLQRCAALSEQHALAPKAAAYGGIGAATGSVVTGAVRATTTTSTIQLGANTARATGVFGIGSLVVPIALIGALYGGMQGLERRDAIVRECLRDLGHRVY